MKIRMLFVDYSEPGHPVMPNVMLAVDEYLNDENPHYWNEHFDKERKAAEENGYAWRVFEVEVNEDVIRNAFAMTLVEGKNMRLEGGGADE